LLFLLQFPLSNRGTEYKIFDSYLYSFLFLGSSIAFIRYYSLKIRNIDHEPTNN
jgi:hypothetical protein